MDFESYDPLGPLQTEWSGGRWVFKTLKGKYLLEDLLLMLDAEKPKRLSFYDDYAANAVKYSFNEMFDVFMRHWVRQLVEMNALNVAERTYDQYLKENLVAGVKKPGKVYAAADKEYAKAYDQYLNLFSKL